MSNQNDDSISSKIETKNVRFNGYLYKVNGIFYNTKKKYWFASSNEHPFLFWYLSDTDMIPQGKFPLINSKINTSLKNNKAFELHNDKNILTLEADSIDEKNEWINHLINIKNLGTKSMFEDELSGTPPSKFYRSSFEKCVKESDLKLCDDEGLTEGIEVENNCITSEPQTLNEFKCTDVNELEVKLRNYMDVVTNMGEQILLLESQLDKAHKREDELRKRNFNLEASYYRLKSRYLLLLNHLSNPGEYDDVKKQIYEVVYEEANLDLNSSFFIENKNEHGIKQACNNLGFVITNINGNNDNNSMNVAKCMAQKASVIETKLKAEQSKFYKDWITKWDDFMLMVPENTPKYEEEFKKLVRTSIPESYRSQLWLVMVNKCVGETRKALGTKYYKTLLENAKNDNIDLYSTNIDVMGDDNYTDPILRLIDSDLTRTLPSNKYFCSLNGEKIPELRRILYAYRYYNKDIGYCQGLNRLAALGLLFLQEEDAFWFLVTCVKLQPKDYYNEKLFGVIIDQAVFSEIVSEKLPRLSHHLKSLDVDFQLYSLKWFMTVFIDSLSHEIYLKIFDCFLNEGNKVIFRFSLALLKMCENDLLESKTFSAAHHILEGIRNRNIQFSDLSNYAFSSLQSFPSKWINGKREFHLKKLEPSSRNDI